MDDLAKLSVTELVTRRNTARQLFTAGPASLLEQNLTGLRPCFGRGDEDYLEAENTVLATLRRMSGHSYLVRMQGSASLALEIICRNYLLGRVLVVDTGFYSDRLLAMTTTASSAGGQVRQVDQVSWQELNTVTGEFDWVVGCATETSIGLKLPITSLRDLADRLEACLMLDATASIGLEEGHELADVIAYSSCKGLFGLTGAAFIASHELPDHDDDSFYLSYTNHREKRMTGPYHAILSLVDVLPGHAEFREAVAINKRIFCDRMNPWLSQADEHQPLLCSHVKRKVSTNNAAAVLYSSRYPMEGSIICHLGEVHLGRAACGHILESLEFSE
jgi:2-aminoethylphosphonate-pyruvate transaminase